MVLSGNQSLRVQSYIQYTSVHFHFSHHSYTLPASYLRFCTHTVSKSTLFKGIKFASQGSTEFNLKRLYFFAEGVASFNPLLLRFSFSSPAEAFCLSCTKPQYLNLQLKWLSIVCKPPNLLHDS